MSVFQVLQQLTKLLPDRTCCATRRAWPGRVHSGQPFDICPLSPRLLLPLCPWAFVELVRNGSPGSQHRPHLGCPSSFCFQGLQQEAAGLADVDTLQQQPAAVSAEEPVEGRASRWLLSFCQLSHCPECVICELPLAPLLRCSWICVRCFGSVGLRGGDRLLFQEFRVGSDVWRTS